MRAGEAFVVTSRSAADTQALGRRLATVLQAGDLLLLDGELGAGKTTFTQGLAAGLGVTDAVTSPTFTLVHQHQGDGAGPGLVHADVYRLDRASEIVDLALPELVEDGVVAVVEWGSRAAGLVGPDHLEVRFDFGAGDDDRTVVFRPAGRAWCGRFPGLAEAVGGVRP